MTQRWDLFIWLSETTHRNNRRQHSWECDAEKCHSTDAIPSTAIILSILQLAVTDV